MPDGAPSANGAGSAAGDDSAPPQRAARTPVGRGLTATGVAVAIVGIVVASAIGVLAFTTDDGAATPEEATRSMIDAVTRNDLIGIVELLPPGERRAVREPVTRLATQIQVLDLVGSLDPARVPGLTFEFTDLQLRSAELARDVHAVDLVGGRLRAEWLGGGQPLTDKARQILTREWGITIDADDASYERDFAAENTRLVAIREGGGWHVSLAYTLAENIRAANGKAMPEMGRGPVAVGADTPDEAVTDLVRAYADGDPDRLVTLLYPEEARAVYDYAPTFLPGAREAASRASSDQTYDVQLNKVETTVEGTGERRRVRFSALDVDIRGELHKQHVWWADGCFHTDQRIDDDDQPFAKTDSCSKDRPRPGDVTAPRDNPIAALAVFGGGADLPAFTVIERNGRWFVSPAHTIADSLVETAERIRPEDLDGYAERWSDTWKAGAGQGLSGEPIRPTAREVAADPTKAGARGKALADRCAQLATGMDAEAVTADCLRRLVRNGKVKVEDLPPTAQAAVN